MFATAMEAHVARLALERDGLRVFIEDEHQPSVEGASWPADGVKVMVAPEDAEHALGVLDQLGGGETKG
ncbi:MAG: DUF2007 domain-containing protein [Planctomycetota bacterium]